MFGRGACERRRVGEKRASRREKRSESEWMKEIVITRRGRKWASVRLRCSYEYVRLSESILKDDVWKRTRH